MKEINTEGQVDIGGLAGDAGLRYPVRVSQELSELLKPNAYLAQMGIRYEERLKAVFRILKGNLIPENGNTKETLPDKGIIIPFAIVKGPFVREEPLTIKAELTDDGGTTEIRLSAMLEDN